MSEQPIIKSQHEASQRGALAIWTVYDRPTDYPDGFIARRFEVGPGGSKATGDTMVGELDYLRQAFWKAGLTKLSREDGDDPKIVESWF